MAVCNNALSSLTDTPEGREEGIHRGEGGLDKSLSPPFFDSKGERKERPLGRRGGVNLCPSPFPYPGRCANEGGKGGGGKGRRKGSEEGLL